MTVYVRKGSVIKTNAMNASVTEQHCVPIIIWPTYNTYKFMEIKNESTILFLLNAKTLEVDTKKIKYSNENTEIKGDALTRLVKLINSKTSPPQHILHPIGGGGRRKEEEEEGEETKRTNEEEFIYLWEYEKIGYANSAFLPRKGEVMEERQKSGAKMA